MDRRRSSVSQIRTTGSNKNWINEKKTRVEKYLCIFQSVVSDDYNYGHQEIEQFLGNLQK